MRTVTKTVLVPDTEVENDRSVMPKRQQVGLLGGNFNPVHNAHLIIADQVYHQLGLDKIYLMPTYESPHVDVKKTISAKHRLEMLNLATVDNPHLEIEETEINQRGKSFTYETMKRLTAENPETDYFFIIGGDMVEYLPKWHRLDELLELVHLVAVRRPNYPATSPYPLIWVDVPLMDLSSSFIRNHVKTGCSINYLVPENVLNYIKTEGLYQDEETD